MKKVILMAIACLLVAGTCFAYSEVVYVTKYEDGSGLIAGVVQHTYKFTPTTDYLHLFVEADATGGHLIVEGRDQYGEYIIGSTTEPNLVDAARGVTDLCEIWAAIDSEGQITDFGYWITSWWNIYY